MTQQIPNDELDTALILEGELKRRVQEVAVKVVHEEVARQMGVIFAEQKAKMMMEISVSIGQMLNLIEKEGRKPLWESTPEEFGLTREELNRSNMGSDYAIRKQTPSV
jgi:hypothetical protein